MFKKILVACRGEIAVRIIRCCREMGIKTVAAYSTADRESLPVMLSDEAVCIGPEKAAESYLRAETLIETARKTGCEAIHPGYGFLSENAEFAELCAAWGIVFIGPPAEVIRRMGDKQAARELMKACGVPVVPGSGGLIETEDDAARIAAETGYPVLLKASAGGGGKGMREARSEEEVRSAFRTAQAEAEAAFGDGSMYLEKLIEHPRHIEVQILADRAGNVVHLGDRDCSMQNHHQKLLEEAPAPFLDERTRSMLLSAAVRAAKAAGYVSAGTVEFIMDRGENFYFIEMNTRIQVEHPVTEEVTGIDIVREQIRIAAGMRLHLNQDGVRLRGHAIECRINAETPGVVRALHLPQGFGVRTESHLYAGFEVGPWYDPLVAKIIARGDTRLEALRRMRRALDELMIDGIRTNAEFMHLVTYHPDFIRGQYDTGFFEKNRAELERWLEEGMSGPKGSEPAAAGNRNSAAPAAAEVRRSAAPAVSETGNSAGPQTEVSAR